MQAVLSIATWRISLLALLAMVSLAGCSSTEGQNAFYLARALNLVTDSPTQTVEIGSLSFQVPFLSGTGYSSAFATSGAIEVRGFVPGANPGDPFEDTLILKPAETADFADATSYTLINYGTVADFRTLTIVNPIVEAVDAQSNLIQIVHAALGAGNVDVYVTAPGNDLTGTAPLFSLSEGQVGTQQAIAFADHRIRITAAGSSDVLFDSGTITPALPGRLLYVIGSRFGPDPAPVFLSQWYNQGAAGVIIDTSAPAFVRLMHLSPGTGPIDLFAEDDYAKPLATNTSFRTQSAYGTATDTLPDGPTVFGTSPIDFAGSASDAEDGGLTDGLTWTSSIDGPLQGNGASISASLSAGDHAIAASATDTGGLTGTDVITVRVLPTEDAAPAVSITRPPSRTSVASGTAITFTGTANDAGDGDLSANLSWTSSIDGALPEMGNSATAILSPGVHAITASAGDSNALIGSDSVLVIVVDTANTAPDVAITAPDIDAVEFDVTLTGDPDSLLLQNSQQVLNGTAYTFAVTGTSADPGGLLLADSIQKISTHTQLRVLHASSLLGPFDVYITAEGAGISGASPIFSGLVSDGFSAFGGFPGRAYDITLTSFNTSDVLMVIPSLNLDNGTVNTLAIVDEPDAMSTGYQLFSD